LAPAFVSGIPSARIRFVMEIRPNRRTRGSRAVTEIAVDRLCSAGVLPAGKVPPAHAQARGRLVRQGSPSVPHLRPPRLAPRVFGLRPWRPRGAGRPSSSAPEAASGGRWAVRRLREAADGGFSSRQEGPRGGLGWGRAVPGTGGGGSGGPEFRPVGFGGDRKGGPDRGDRGFVREYLSQAVCLPLAAGLWRARAAANACLHWT